MRWLRVFAFCVLPVLAATDDWGPLEFLIGQWSGQGNGSPGTGSGSFSFQPDLQRQILVRKSFADYPPAADKPASRHDDLMIVYREGTSRQLRAIYFDNEGHVIRYTVDATAERVVFTSDGARSEERYRMTYWPADLDQLDFRFEVATPGKDLATYIDAKLRRAAAARAP